MDSAADDLLRFVGGDLESSDSGRITAEETGALRMMLAYVRYFSFTKLDRLTL